jgi:hypothetical protein
MVHDIGKFIHFIYIIKIVSKVIDSGVVGVNRMNPTRPNGVEDGRQVYNKYGSTDTLFHFLEASSRRETYGVILNYCPGFRL